MEAVVEIPGGQIDVFGSDQIADAGAVVALLDLVPPALALIFDHGGFFDEDSGRGRTAGAEEVEEGEVGSGDRGEEFPAGEDGGFAGARADMGEEFCWLFAAFDDCSCCAGAGEAGVDGGKEFFGYGRFSEREKQGVIEWRAAALRLGIELADGFDLVTEEVDANGAVHLGGVDVEDAAAEGDLAGHFDYVHLRVADGEQVLDQHVWHVFFAGFEVQGEGAVVVAGKELHACGFDWRDDEAGLGRGYLPKSGCACLLDLGVGGEVFEGKDVVGGEAQDGFGGESARQLAGT